MIRACSKRVNGRGRVFSTKIDGAGSSELIRQLPAACLAEIDVVFFVQAHIEDRLATVFPNVITLSVDQHPHPMPTSIVREICVGFAACNQLRNLYLDRCGLTELPASLALLSNLRILGVAGNNILWVHHRLATTLRHLRLLDTSHNNCLPRHLVACWGDSTCQSKLRSLCALDAAYRARILCFMAMLRQGLGMGRDVAELLGKALFQLRDFI